MKEIMLTILTRRYYRTYKTTNMNPARTATAQVRIIKIFEKEEKIFQQDDAPRAVLLHPARLPQATSWIIFDGHQPHVGYPISHQRLDSGYQRDPQEAPAFTRRRHNSPTAANSEIGALVGKMGEIFLDSSGEGYYNASVVKVTISGLNECKVTHYGT